MAELSEDIAKQLKLVRKTVPPAGGLAGYALCKDTDKDYDFSWHSMVDEGASPTPAVPFPLLLDDGTTTYEILVQQPTGTGITGLGPTAADGHWLTEAVYDDGTGNGGLLRMFADSGIAGSALLTEIPAGSSIEMSQYATSTGSLWQVYCNSGAGVASMGLSGSSPLAFQLFGSGAALHIAFGSGSGDEVTVGGSGDKVVFFGGTPVARQATPAATAAAIIALLQAYNLCP